MIYYLAQEKFEDEDDDDEDEIEELPMPWRPWLVPAAKASIDPSH